MYELRVRGDFPAAHFLRGYEGKCKNLHGHTWKVEVTLTAEKLDSVGMVCDFQIVKKKLRELLETVDHVCLNDLEFFKTVNPTTENLAKYIFDNLVTAYHPLKVQQVQIWESDNASITYYSG